MRTISPPVFYYHSVAPEPFDNWMFYFLTLRLEVFENQMAYLKNKGFRGVFFDEWMEIRTGEKASEGKEVCISLDDGFLDNWVYAFPVAKKYGIKITLFIAPECVDPRDIVRPTLEDVWNGNCEESDLEARGFVSWNELKIMQDSGLVDIQSHTMSHDKYISSTELKSFYYGDDKGFYPIWNAKPEIKPYYLADPNFEHYIPFGTPLFEEASAVITKKHSLNEELTKKVAFIAAEFNLKDLAQRESYEKKVSQVIKDFQQSDELFDEVESTEDYRKRLFYEIVDSKKILEQKLDKPVQFLCWPHGDNTKEAHDLAKESGYLATTAGKMTEEANNTDRIPRFGAPFNQKRWKNLFKFQYKISSHYKKQPYYLLWQANRIKLKLSNKI